LPQLGDAQLQAAERGVEGAVAVAVAPGGPLAAALVASGAVRWTPIVRQPEPLLKV
jgi:hypothetical protein